MSDLKERFIQFIHGLQDEICSALEGADGLVNESDAATEWLRGPIMTIAGGSNEIQLNILSKRALGLPGA